MSWASAHGFCSSAHGFSSSPASGRGSAAHSHSRVRDAIANTPHLAAPLPRSQGHAPGLRLSTTVHAASQPGMGTDTRRTNPVPQTRQEQIAARAQLQKVIPPSVRVDALPPLAAGKLPGALQEGRYAFWPKQLPGAASRKFRQPVAPAPAARAKGVAPIGATLGTA
eukprot:3508398-Prymnesium_polylepis.2